MTQSEEYAGGQVTKLALLSMPRTGSTMITRQLSTHPKVFFIGAIFSRAGWLGEGPGRQQIRTGLDARWNDLDFRIAHHEELMAKAFGLAPAGGCSGIKHHLSGSPLVTEAAIKDPTIGKILLTRNNVLASYASDVVTKMAAAGGSDIIDRKPRFVIAQFEQYRRIRKRVYGRWASRILSAPGPSIEIDYSFARTPQGIQHILHFIGLDPMSVEAPRTRKRNSDDLSERFENNDELLDYLKSQGLESWRVESFEPSVDQLEASLN